MNTLLHTPFVHSIEQPAQFKKKLLYWANTFDVVCFLDSNDHSAGRCLMAVGHKEMLTIDLATDDSFDQFKVFYDRNEDWLFTGLSYDLKNATEDLTSQHLDKLGFPDLHCFVPQFVLEIKGEELVIHSSVWEENTLLLAIEQVELKEESSLLTSSIDLQNRLSKKEYLETIERIREHIKRGDIYEMNFCQEFFAHGAKVNPLPLFIELNQLSKAPFAAFYKCSDRYLLCASPERFLQKTGTQLISQPIKGTRPRHKDPILDLALKKALFESQKDRSENVMVVDMVRNDLARSCEVGTVKVPELYGIYSFEHVHQMISTVTGNLKSSTHLIDAIRMAYPMGSMTGTPKLRAMQLIEQYEKTKRGWYSGSVGYIKPNGDFDFNVVIRSLLYNATQEYLSFQVGGAIVFDSIGEEEYKECLVKARGILEVLGINS